MIKYSLQCAEGHRFESWFADADAYDRLAAAGHVACAVCGGSGVEKSIMAPRIGGAASRQEAEHPLSQPLSPAEQAMAELKKRIEEKSEYVGRDFVRVARAIHEGDEPSRSIHGEARLGDARALIEDGIPVAPLPFTPQRKTN